MVGWLSMAFMMLNGPTSRLYTWFLDIEPCFTTIFAGTVGQYSGRALDTIMMMIFQLWLQGFTGLFRPERGVDEPQSVPLLCDEKAQ